MTVAEPTPVVISGTKLEILPGFGFRSALENGRLALEQDDADGNTDNVVLSRTEMLALVFEYAPWIGVEVTKVTS